MLFISLFFVFVLPLVFIITLEPSFIALTQQPHPPSTTSHSDLVFSTDAHSVCLTNRG